MVLGLDLDLDPGPGPGPGMGLGLDLIMRTWTWAWDLDLGLGMGLAWGPVSKEEDEENHLGSHLEFIWFAWPWFALVGAGFGFALT